MINYSDFEKVDIRVGTVIEAKLNKKSSNPSLYVLIDFGEKIGQKKTSAQLTKHYLPEELIGKQVAAVINFPPKLYLVHYPQSLFSKYYLKYLNL